MHDSHTLKSENLSRNCDFITPSNSLLFFRIHGFTELRQFRKGKMRINPFSLLAVQDTDKEVKNDSQMYGEGNR